MRVPDVPEAESSPAHPGGSRESEALPLPIRGLRLPVRAQAEHGQTRGWSTPETQTFCLSHLFKGKQISHLYFHQTYQKYSGLLANSISFYNNRKVMEFAEMGVRGWNQGGGWSIVPLY